jgi:general secretion pathway protein C
MIAVSMNKTSVLQGLPATPEAWKSFFVANGPRIATGVLAVGIGVQAAVLVTDLAGAGSESPPIDAGPPPAMPARLDVVALVNSHLFGEAPVGAVGDGSNAPATNLALVLAGVLANSDPMKGIAILGESAAGAKVFVVGDMVPGGARLHAVYQDRVVLQRAGALESLMMPRQSLATGPIAPPVPPPASADVQILDRMRRLIEEDPGLIGDVMRPQPVFAEGKQRGYRVYPGRNRAAFAQLGLRPGDLVTEINGTPLDDPARGNEIFRTLGSASEARVTVMRSGRQQELALNLAQVAAQAEALADDDSSGPDAAAVAVGEAPETPTSDAAADEAAANRGD